ncbi:MAG TPA: AAA family ATPase [Actinophytocola sp.]|uniref:helix-turn-helix transcriptional regulator n=1 Tax=Actinophytocola sp. TaxID=1872138 RepID=UPI002E027946|nr:AAA family ATPase [Actinophytocola sp.]
MRPGVESAILVGRGGELAVLRDALAGAGAEQPATVLVGGESGVGKSRLVRELLAGLGGGRARALVGMCVELGGAGLPYAPFTAALRGSDVRLDVAGDGELGRVRLFERVLAELDRLAEERPLVLVIEDAHWADRSSRDLLDFLVRNQQSVPRLLLVVTYRAEDVHRAHPLRSLIAELTRLPWVRRLELGRLSRADVVAQMRAIRGREPEPELVDAIYRRSEGNPLFVEALLDGGPPAASLADLLLDRIERLPAETGAVLRAAAAGGAAVPHAVLVAVTGLDDAALSAVVRPAVDANVIMVDGDGYAFRHALIREAVYGSLLPGERGPLHRRYAEVLAGGREVGVVARHLIAAGEAGPALVAAHGAALDRAASLAFGEQLEMLAHVLRLWPSVPDAAGRIGADRVSVLEWAVEAAHSAGDHARGAGLATEALALVDQGSEPVRAARLLVRRGLMRRQTGQAGDLDDLRAAVALVPAGDPARAGVLNDLAGRYLEGPPMPDAARAAAEEALTLARRTGDDRAQAAAMVTLAILAARLGDLDAQLVRLAEARRLAERVGSDHVVMRSLHHEASILLGFGRAERSAEIARAALTRVQAMGVARAYGAGHAIDLIGALYALGRWDEALDGVEHALSLAPPATFRAHLLCYRGVISLHRGDLAVAEDAVAQSHELLAGAAGFAQDPLRLPRLEIRLRLAQGRTADALAVLEQALELPYLADAARFTWNLLALGAHAVAEAHGQTPLLSRLREVADRVGRFTPVQHAEALVFEAELTRAGGTFDRTAWDAAVRAWDELNQPHRLAQALLPAAEAAVLDGDRDTAAAMLRRAAKIADDLGATPLRGRIDDLARRARITVTAKDTVPDDQVRRELGLTPREMEILRLVSAGRGNREIAEELFISAKTASVHVSNVIAKLGVANRVEAAAAAHRLGVLDTSGG